MTENPPRFKFKVMDIRREEREGVVILRISGDLDISTTTSLRRELENIVREGQKHAIIDLSLVHYMDSAGRSLLLRWCRSDRLHMRICSVPAALKHIMEQTEIDHLFSLYATEMDAFLSFSRLRVDEQQNKI